MGKIVLKNAVVLLDDEDLQKFGSHGWYYTDYVMRHIKGSYPTRKEYLHKLVLGAGKGQRIDHINNNTLDCRKQNLRPASHKENNRNSSKDKSKCSSIYKGVYFDKQMKKFRARIYADGKINHIGLFDNEHKAGEAYNHKAIHFYGMFAKLNDIPLAFQQKIANITI